jgi:D-inositol-3-phosphate glycosyltransferase
VRRVAVLSVHTSPLDAPGGGDAGGMNVYIVQTATRLADAGVAVEIFTRATASDQPSAIEIHPGVLVRNIIAGPFDGLGKLDLPAQLCAFAASVLRAEAYHEPGWYDVIHSHYWLSGQVGWLARDRWRVPLVHAAHTLGKVKNAALAEGDSPEPLSRIVGEEQVVAEADRLVASTDDEARELIEHYGANPDKVAIVAPGVDLETFAPEAGARQRLGIDERDLVLLFVGRIQPLKAPDVLLRAVANLKAHEPALNDRLRVIIVGAPSGTGLADPQWLQGLSTHLGLERTVQFVPPVAHDKLADYYRAADLTIVPSYNESFGLVALESQACGTPVVAAAVGGRPTAVSDGVSGLLVAGHDPHTWAHAIGKLLWQPGRLAELTANARDHAAQFSWQRTTQGLLDTYVEAAKSMAENR